MAAAAGLEALHRSGLDPHAVRLVLHSYVNHQGQDHWTPAHYVQGATVGSSAAAAIELKQACNGALAAIELAAPYLSVQQDAAAVLITAGDSFKAPFVDRWKSDDQAVFGDGGSAAVLSNRPGFARLVVTASRSEPSLEPLYRGAGAWTKIPFESGRPIDLGGRKDDWLLRHEDDYEEVFGLMNETLAVTLADALDAAGTSAGKVRWFVHANVVRPVAEWAFYRALHIDPAKTTYQWGLDYGHMGNSDQFAGISQLVRTGRVEPGDTLVTFGVGAGFMWTVAVFEIIDVPDWA